MNSHPDFAEVKARAAARASEILESLPVYLDTETTGLDSRAEICDLAVVDHDGTVLLDTLVRPSRPIPPEASRVHGITDEMVADAPGIAEVLPRLAEVLAGRTLVIYNAVYDLRMLVQAERACGVQVRGCSPASSVHCAMELYAEWWGEWNDYHGSFRWQKLGAAARQQNIALPPDLHRARADAELTRRLMEAMAHAAQPYGEFRAELVAEGRLPDREVR
jgi:DNA polymerase-3 subunit epsilon